MAEELTLYDVAKQAIANEGQLDPIKVNLELKEISEKMNKNYYMIICPDLRQYVIIHINNRDNIVSELATIFYNRGKLVLIDRDNEKREIWEFWVRDIYNGQNYMYQMTPYEVVEV